MNATTVLEAVNKYEDAHQRRPARGYVSPRTAEQLMKSLPSVHAEPRHFGHNVLGVTDWFTDPHLSDGEIRLEPQASAQGDGAGE